MEDILKELSNMGMSQFDLWTGIAAIFAGICAFAGLALAAIQYFRNHRQSWWTEFHLAIEMISDEKPSVRKAGWILLESTIESIGILSGLAWASDAKRLDVTAAALAAQSYLAGEQASAKEVDAHEVDKEGLQLAVDALRETVANLKDVPRWRALEKRKKITVHREERKEVLRKSTAKDFPTERQKRDAIPGELDREMKKTLDILNCQKCN